MRSGQAGYQLATHGGRVPIQWLVGTDGWAMFIHHPLGTFDFTGAEGKFAPAGDALPLDVFVVASPDPADIMREYARITGFAEMPALWTLGYMQSHRTLAGPDEVLGVARTMREKKLPCDAPHLPRHRVHAVGVEHPQRRVHLAQRQLPRSERR